jgi:hypothetical protein
VRIEAHVALQHGLMERLSMDQLTWPCCGAARASSGSTAYPPHQRQRIAAGHALDRLVQRGVAAAGGRTST